MHRQMADMMKAMGKNKGMFARMFGGGAMPEPTPEMVEQMKRGELPKGLPRLPPGGLPGLPGLSGGLPGLGGAPKFPGLPGLPGKKK
jgi:signal recognition particle subunit SRP54